MNARTVSFSIFHAAENIRTSAGTNLTVSRFNCGAHKLVPSDAGIACRERSSFPPHIGWIRKPPFLLFESSNDFRAAVERWINAWLRQGRECQGFQSSHFILHRLMRTWDYG